MNKLLLIIALSVLIATLLIFVIWVALWKSRKKKRQKPESEEEFLSKGIQIHDEPLLETKTSSVQPIYKPYPYEVKTKSSSQLQVY